MQNNNPIMMIQQYNEFKRSLTENPQEKINELISSGRITQQELNNLQAQGRIFQMMLNKFRQ